MVAYHSLAFRIQNASPEALNRLDAIERSLAGIAEQAGLHVVNSVSHEFSPQGISTALLLRESHIAMHTWPEKRSGYITLTTCRPISDGLIASIEHFIQNTFGAADVRGKAVVF
jgi:putative adenosylmethionine decarboxylase